MISDDDICVTTMLIMMITMKMMEIMMMVMFMMMLLLLFYVTAIALDWLHVKVSAVRGLRKVPCGVLHARNLTPPRGVLHSLPREGHVQSVLMAANRAIIACPVGMAASSVHYLVVACEHPLHLPLFRHRRRISDEIRGEGPMLTL